MNSVIRQSLVFWTTAQVIGPCEECESIPDKNDLLEYQSAYQNITQSDTHTMGSIQISQEF